MVRVLYTHSSQLYPRDFISSRRDGTGLYFLFLGRLVRRMDMKLRMPCMGMGTTMWSSSGQGSSLIFF
jgi:hypothetical protein